jgi:outer membrane protein assembly complex protein YaeT
MWRYSSCFSGDMALRAKPAGQYGKWLGYGVLLAGYFVFLAGCTPTLLSQTSTTLPDAPAVRGSAITSRNKQSAPPAQATDDPDPLAQWLGMPVRSITFQGVSADRLAPFPKGLAQGIGTPLDRDKLSQSLRQVFATGLFETVQVDAEKQGDGVALIFNGAPRKFIGTVTVDGAKGATLNAQLQQATRLRPGTRFTQSRMNLALEQIRQALADNGFHEPVITHVLTPHPEDQLVDIAFHVVSGPQARVGVVEVTGDSGMTVGEFRRYAHLHTGARIDHDTANRALSGVLKHYQKQDRLEAEIKLESQVYAPSADKSSFRFSANRGPVVTLHVQGASIGQDRLKRIIPIYEEGTVDEDLLNEGDRRLRDFYQRQGYFDVKVEHQRLTPQPNRVDIVYTVTLGSKRRVESVRITGNHYFDRDTLEDMLSVHAADPLDRHGTYSQALVVSDINALQAVYQNNGFSQVKVTPTTTIVHKAITSAHGSHKPAPFTVVYHIDEGAQQRVGTVQLQGNDHVDAQSLMSLLNTVPGQLFSPQNLAGDRDTLLTEYLSRGFDRARVDVEEKPETDKANTVDVIFHITEGPQNFVRKVRISGLHYTRPTTIARAITLHPGDPLNETALLETQRNLYDFALFNEVNTAIENPAGGERYKTILVQTTEARRWALTYGLGFEAQTGTPQNNCGSAYAIGASCNPNGKTGISPRVLIDITRNNLFGREQSASVQATYGLLEQRINLLFQNPHFYGNRNFGFTFSGGYANSQDVTTYVASRLQAGIRWTENFNTPGIGLSKANTFVYEFDFRRVKVAESSLQVGPSELTALSTASRVAGPGFTWIRDTRDSPLDAHRGTYSSFQAFLSSDKFGADAQFSRLDVSNSSFYGFDKDRFVLARNTRYGMERAYGAPADELIPLPERLYAGGPVSLRGFSINAAGPRDPETGYPIGGAGALVNSTELRLPPPTLPWLGNSLSFVIFHDMGNVFTNAGDMWASALRIHQPNRNSCKVLADPANQASYNPNGPVTSTGQLGQCSFDFFSHALGLGLRYHTPVGPIRLDFSYNLNPPIYPVNIDYSHPQALPHVGEAPHFNFFFSLGQTF